MNAKSFSRLSYAGVAAALLATVVLGTVRAEEGTDAPAVTAPVELPSMPAGPGTMGGVGPVVAARVLQAR